MSVIDDRGRVFGRVNLVDAAAAAFVLLLIPLAYGTWLLFRPAKPRITSVTQVPVTREERRIAGPVRAMAKLKVKGRGLTPMLRAWIGTEPSLGFVFEDPNSADVIVPPMGSGTYDLILTDNAQEVARAPRAVVFPANESRERIKVVGRLVDLDRATAESLKVGDTIRDASGADVRVAALGELQSGRAPLVPAVEVAKANTFSRSASLVIGCDADPAGGPCSIHGVTPAVQTLLPVPGTTPPLTIFVDDLLPAAEARPADVTVRVTGGSELALVRAGDRDDLLDSRAAVVTSLEPSAAASGRALDLHLRLGVDAAHDGWRYRGRVVKPGAPFVLTTDRYVVTGTVVSVPPHE